MPGIKSILILKKKKIETQGVGGCTEEQMIKHPPMSYTSICQMCHLQIPG